MPIMRLVLALGVAALAPVVALQALANADVLIPPAQYWNGYQTAKSALARLEASGEVEGGMPQFLVRKPGPELARRAFASEPLASDALFVLAVDAREHRGEDAARELIRLSGQLELRNRFVGILRMQDALADRDIDAAFAVLDQFSLVNPDLSGPLVMAMTPQLADPALRAALGDALSREPVWAQDFWTFAPRNPEAVPGLLELRSRIDTGTSVESDALLLAAAVRQEHYRDALEMWQRLAGDESDPLAYRADEAYAPIGWAFEQDARKSVNYSPSSGYRIFVASNSSGLIGRQLVRPSPGQYVLELEGEASVIARMQSALYCADGDGEVRWQAGAEETRFTVSGACSVYWLALGADTFEQRDTLEGTLTRIEFRRAR